MDENGKFVELNINDILPNRFQPRIYFNEKKLNELAISIDKHGVIQPIIVRPVNNKYEIISGERRYKASKLANKATIPAIIRNLSDRDSEEIALLENVQRQDLTPIEEAVSYKRILDSGYMTQEELAKKLGKSQPTIANKVRLLNLDDTVQEALLYGKISERHARSLLRLTNREMQRNMLSRIISERLTVRKTDEEIAKALKNQPKIEPITNNKTTLEPQTNVLKTSVAAESLFADNEIPKKDERKDGFMDIDKIMREAKDINVDNKPNDISQLMNQDPSMKTSSENIVAPNPAQMPNPQLGQSSTNAQPIVNDDNKFVHYIPTETPKVEEVRPQNTTGVSFNSIFNSTPADLVANSKPVQKEQSIIQADPVSAENNKSETIKAEESSNVIMANENNNSIASAVSAAFEAAANYANNENNISNPSIQIQANQSVSNPNVLETNFGTVNDVPETTSIVNELNTLTTESSPLEQNANASVHPITNSIPERPVDNISTPEASSIPLASENTVPSIQNETITDPSVNHIPETPVSPVFNQSSIFPSTNNIPIEDIYEDNIEESNQEVKPSMMSTPTKAVNVNNFRNIIHLIRECADKIEALGYNINLDEVDLDNNYQVTFTIDK